MATLDEINTKIEKLTSISSRILDEIEDIRVIIDNENQRKKDEQEIKKAGQ